MLLRNLASVEWVQVSCSQPLLKDIFCEDQRWAHKLAGWSVSWYKTWRRSRKSTANRSTANSQVATDDERNLTCSPIHLFMNKMCVSFSWLHRNQVHPGHKCSWSEFGPLDKILLSIFKAAHVPLHFLLFIDKNSSFSLTKETRVHQGRHSLSDVKFANVTGASGFYPCEENHLLLESGDHVFKKHGRFMSVVSVCNLDSNRKFSLPIDKNGIVFGFETKDQPQTNKTICSEQNKTKKCSSLFLRSTDGKCQMLLSVNKEKISFRETRIKFQCPSNVELESHLVNDLVADCGPDGGDEPILISLLQNQSMYSCSEMHQIPCRKGHTKCLNLEHLCNFRLDKQSNVSPCRTGEHLVRCKNFECNNRYKCAQSYCVPMNYLGDGKWDCADGDDERNETVSSQARCVGKFKCHLTHFMCINLASVCDGMQDCIIGDDETLCELRSIKCLKGCKCFALAIECNQQNRSTFPNEAHQFPYISVVFNDISPFKTSAFAHLFPKIIFLTLKNSTVQTLTRYLLRRQVISADLSVNNVSEIHRISFVARSKLRTLSLDFNNILILHAHCFTHLTSLHSLNLSKNPILDFPEDLFSSASQLQYLSLRGIVPCPNVPSTKLN